MWYPTTIRSSHQIVQTNDVVVDTGSGRGLRNIGARMDEVALEQSEEAFRRRVVSAGPDRSLRTDCLKCGL